MGQIIYKSSTDISDRSDISAAVLIVYAEYFIVQVQPSKHVLDHADYSAPTR